MRPDNLEQKLYIIGLALVAVASILGLTFISEFTGRQVAVESSGGTVTAVDIRHTSSAFAWSAWFGAAVTDPNYNNLQSDNATPAGQEEANLIFQCFQPGIEHELYVLISNPQSIDFRNIVPATTDFIDSYYSLVPSSSGSANNTFKETMSVTIGNNSFTIPAVTTYVLGDPDSTNFRHGIMKDENNNPVFVTKITNFTAGFNGRTYNYQIFVGVPEANKTQKYYFYTDPFDTCPSGLFEAGTATFLGYVHDNVTGLPLGDVTVSINGKVALTNGSGYFEIVVNDGTHVFAGIKSGYNTYIDSVTLALNTFVRKDFNMTPALQVAVGPGIGPGIGP